MVPKDPCEKDGVCLSSQCSGETEKVDLWGLPASQPSLLAEFQVASERLISKKNKVEASGLVQWIKVSAAKPNDLGSNAGILMMKERTDS